jgi:replication factor C subunit 1
VLAIKRISCADMDIRSFLGKPKTGASKPSAPSPSASAAARRGERLVAEHKSKKSNKLEKGVIDVDDDEDGDADFDVGMEEGENDDDDGGDEDDAKAKSKPRGKARTARTAKRAKNVLVAKQALNPKSTGAVNIDDNNSNDDDDNFSAKPSKKKAGIKRARGGDVAEANGAVGVSNAGFGGEAVVEDAPDGDGEPDTKKLKAAAYQAFINRGGPPNKGLKERPVGASNCLDKKVFVITGVLDSLERDECTDLIKQYGGRCVSAVSGKVTHGIVGLDPGASKLLKLQEKKIKIIDEDDLFAMISKTRKQTKAAACPATPPPAAADDDDVVDLEADDNDDDDAAVVGAKPSRVAKITGGLSKSPVPINPPTRPSPNNMQLWVEKYKPHDEGDLVANPGIYKQMSTWLQTWKSKHLVGDDSHSKGRKKSGNASGKDEDQPALLLAGPPGIGKTTAAHVLCRANGFEPHEFNASDVRNKKGVEQLAQSVMLGASMSQYFNKSTPSSKAPNHLAGANGKKKKSTGTKYGQDEYPNGQVLIMDEVDGMSGGDRGGGQELMKWMKKSKVPIICICNDDSSQKMRTLAGHCYKLKFRRPMANQVRDRLIHIAKREGYHAIDNPTAEKLAESCHGDIRQMINLLQTWRSGSQKLSFTDVAARMAIEGKTFEQQDIFALMMKQFASSSSTNTVADRMDDYFLDSDLMGLFVAENYLSTRSASQPGQHGLKAIADAAEAISDGDLANTLVRGGQRWDLMPAISVLACTLPGHVVTGGLNGRPMFPSFLGNMSKGTKNRKVVRELEMRVKAVGTSSGSARAFRLDYIPVLTMTMATPLIKNGQDAIPEVIERLDAYYLQKDDWNAIMELGCFKKDFGPLDAISGAIKSALTREYNKMSHDVSTVTGAKLGAKGKQSGGEAVKKSSAATGEDVAVVDEDGASEDEDEDGNDSDVDLAQFKVKTKAVSKKAPAKKGTAKKAPAKHGAKR